MGGPAVRSAQPEPRVERAEEDVEDVERAQLALLEERAELVAVARPPGRGVEPEEEADHGAIPRSRSRPSDANDASAVSCSWRTVAPRPVSRYGRRRSTGGRASISPRSSSRARAA